MKKKGIIVAAFFGFILLTSTVMISLPGLMTPIDTETTITGTPADNFPDAQRAQFCGS
ncbi:MAG: lyase, partial [Nitrosopumilaceae archaeon]|nr:lyase [Nitrosopumilaceae archaeon]